jgi:hypothetical protein
VSPVSPPVDSNTSQVRHVGVLPQMDPWSASTRYRALQHVPALRSRFDVVECLLPNDSVDRQPGRLGQVNYFATHAVRYGARYAAVAKWSLRHDSLLVQRGLYPMGPAAVVNGLKRFTGRIVFDLDDALFETRPLLTDRAGVTRWLYGPQQTLALLRRADAVVVSTQALADSLPVAPTRLEILPTILNPTDYPVVSHAERSIATVGWAGTVGGLGYLEFLRPLFEQLRRNGIAELLVVSSEPLGEPATFRRWRASEESSVFTRFDIGIMPLPDTPYTRAKAGFKLLQYMAAGLPVVASPVGVNSELVMRSGAGYLASTPSDWGDALRELAGDADLRARLGAAGRAFVTDYADLGSQAGVLADLLTGD